jgi:hypothetical protein
MTRTSASGSSATIRSLASLPRSSLRLASTTLAPLRASSRAVSKPIPLFAPVTIATLPL